MTINLLRRRINTYQKFQGIDLCFQLLGQSSLANDPVDDAYKNKYDILANAAAGLYTLQASFIRSRKGICYKILKPCDTPVNRGSP